MSNDKPAALVTGAATGIGRSAAVALARNGYDVAVNFSRSADAARITARACEAAGARALLYRADVSDDAAVRAMMAATEQEFGRLDVLINNAGTTVDVDEFQPLDGRGLQHVQRQKADAAAEVGAVSLKLRQARGE